jgi:hypothetical protein
MHPTPCKPVGDISMTGRGVRADRSLMSFTQATDSHRVGLEHLARRPQPLTGRGGTRRTDRRVVGTAIGKLAMHVWDGERRRLETGLGGRARLECQGQMGECKPRRPAEKALEMRRALPHVHDADDAIDGGRAACCCLWSRRCTHGGPTVAAKH